MVHEIKFISSKVILNKKIVRIGHLSVSWGSKIAKEAYTPPHSPSYSKIL